MMTTLPEKLNEMLNIEYPPGKEHELELLAAEFRPEELSWDYCALVSQSHTLVRNFNKAKEGCEDVVKLAEQCFDRYIELASKIFLPPSSGNDLELSVFADDSESARSIIPVALALRASCFATTSLADPVSLDTGLQLRCWADAVEPALPLSQVAELADDAAAADATPIEEQDSFWPLVGSTIVCGRLALAKRLLDACLGAQWDRIAAKEQHAISGVALMLETYPTEGGAQAFRKWREDVLCLATEIEALPSGPWPKRLGVLAALLRADKAALMRHASSWRQLLVSKYLFGDPSPRLLPIYVQQSLLELGLSPGWGDRAQALALQGDAWPALKRLSDADPLTGAVIVELLACSPKLGPEPAHGPMSQRLLLAINHAVSLLFTPALAPLGLAMLHSIGGPAPRAILAGILPAVAEHARANNQVSVAQRAREVAQEMGLSSTVRELYKAEGEILEANQDWVEAATAYVAADDSAALQQLVWAAFGECAFSGRALGSEQALTVLRGTAKASALPHRIRVALAPLGTLVAALDRINTDSSPTSVMLLAQLMEMDCSPVYFLPLLGSACRDGRALAQLGTLRLSQIMTRLDSIDPAILGESAEKSEMAGALWLEELNASSETAERAVRLKLAESVFVYDTDEDYGANNGVPEILVANNLLGAATQVM